MEGMMSTDQLQVEGEFSDFFETWVGQLEEYVTLLLRASKHTISDEAELQVLVSKLTSHHKQYYTVKWAHAHKDVLAFFSPPWLTPLENANTWVTGWQPSMAFRLTARAATLSGVTDEQARKLEALRVRIKFEEYKVDREMERQQVAVADRRMVELSRMESRCRNGEVSVAEVEGLVDAAIKGLLGGLEKTMKAADCVRLKTLKGILEVLSPLQCVHFLASISTIQIRLRQCGKKKTAHCSNILSEKPPINTFIYLSSFLDFM